MCLRFSDMESKLGEIDRARAIYSYCSQICDPRVREPLTYFLLRNKNLPVIFAHSYFWFICILSGDCYFLADLERIWDSPWKWGHHSWDAENQTQCPGHIQYPGQLYVLPDAESHNKLHRHRWEDLLFCLTDDELIVTKQREFYVTCGPPTV